MYTRLTGVMVLLFSLAASAAEPDHSTDHGAQTYGRLEAEVFSGIDDQSNHPNGLEFDGRYGTDENRIRLTGDVDRNAGSTEQASLGLAWNRPVAEFWDLELGFLHEIRPEAYNWMSLGITGLAPFFFETDVQMLISEQGEMALKARQTNDFLLTQRLILQSSMMADLYLQDIPATSTPSGLSRLGAGLQLRYEINRQFAPYLAVDYRYEKVNNSGPIATAPDRDTIITTLGLRLLF
jgi:copper resistance protein B